MSVDSTPVTDDVTLDQIYRLTGFGGYGSTKLDFYYGLDITNSGLPVEPVRDVNAFVFFTRPTLNMSSNNFGLARKLEYLLSENTNSMANLIRCTLMPRYYRNLRTGTKSSEINSLKIPQSSYVDELNPFIPMLTSRLTGISGWPTKMVDFFTSAEGLGKENWSYVDGHREYYGEYQLTTSFANTRNSPIEALITAWTYYSLAVSDGSMVALPEMRAKRRVDYQTRPYVLLMDETCTFVQKIACAGNATWMSSPEADSFNIDTTQVFNQGAAELSLSLKCHGVRYNDPIIVQNFNSLVLMYNPSLLDGDSYVKLIPDEYLQYNRRAIPFINIEDGYKLEWYMPSDRYEEISQAYNSVT